MGPIMQPTNDTNTAWQRFSEVVIVSGGVFEFRIKLCSDDADVSIFKHGRTAASVVIDVVWFQRLHGSLNVCNNSRLLVGQNGQIQVDKYKRPRYSISVLGRG